MQIYEYTAANAKVMSEEPKDLKELGELIANYDKFNLELQEEEKIFPIIREDFRILGKSLFF